MALNFYTSIDLNQNQLIQPRIENLGSDPTGVEGQIYFDTANFKLKVYANGAWANVGDQGTDGVDTLTIGNAAVNAGGVNTGLVFSASTGAVILTPYIYGGGTNVGFVPTGGSVGEYLDGGGNWVTVTTGDVTAVQAATANALKGISVASSTGPIPVVGLDIINQTNISATPANDDELVIYDLSTTTNKSITVANLMLAAPQGDIESVVGGTGITVDNGSGPNATVNVDYAGVDNVVLSATDGTGVTLADADDFLFNDSDVSTAKYANLSQLKTYINAGNFDDFIISDGTTTQTINDGETVTFTQVDTSVNGLINLAVTATNTVTAHAIIGAAGVATASTLVNRDGSGNIWVTTVNGELTGTINTTTTAATQATTNNTTLVATTAFVQQEIAAQTIAFTAAGTTGTDQTITNGNTLTLSNVATTAAKGGIETVGVNTDTVRFDLNLGGLLPMTSGFDASQDYIIISDNAAHNTRTLPQYIPINDWGAADGTVDLGSQLISNVLDPVGLQDAATKNYVDVAVTGLLDFKGGFNASSGIITSGANNGLYLWGVTRVAVSVGDLYIAAGSASGNFFGDSDYPLTPGDSVYAVNAVAANTTVVTDFAVAQADTDLATAGANAGAASLGISSYDSANFSVSTGFVSISNVDLGTETTGNYTATVAADTTALYKGIRVSGATGEGQAAVVGFNLSGLTNLGAVPETNDELLILDESTNENKSVTVANLAGTVQDANSYANTYTLAAGVAKTVTHSLGTYDVIVQTYDATTYENVVVTVDRTGTSTITLTADTLPPNDIRCLVQKIIA
tara:strand:+ start:1528 stop:3930 length:2403 start_codon:yes stop_codon:yes gene_type:complete